jgi:hypothetical protein
MDHPVLSVTTDGNTNYLSKSNLEFFRHMRIRDVILEF